MAAQTPDLAGGIDRRRRLLAVGFDVGGGLVAMLAALAIATLWLLLRSGLGRDDAGGGDAVLALSLVAGVAPAWAVYLGAALWRGGMTPGQRRAGVAVQSRGSGEASAPFNGPRVSGALVEPGEAPGTARWRRALRLAVHPISLPVWGWVALTALLAGVPWLWLPFALATVAVALAGAVSLVLLLVWPSMPALHDRVAGTSLAAPAARGARGARDA
jgi:hypothetical protein